MMRSLLLIFCLCVGFSYSLADNLDPNEAEQGRWIEGEAKVIMTQAQNLDPKVLKLSLHAYLKARQQGKDGKQLLTVVDYSKPSSEKRMWVIDVKRHKVLFHTWVAHGKNSGGVHATSFSNNVNSLKTSLGVFVTKEPYIGKHGLSLRVAGLEKGINDNAERRSVVIHGAGYVGEDIAKSPRGVGKSWGCLAVDPKTVKPIVDTIKDDTVVVAYYPDRKWLSQSSFVNYKEV